MPILYKPTDEEIDRAMTLLKFKELVCYKVKHILKNQMLEFDTNAQHWLAVSSRDVSLTYSVNGSCTCPARAKSPTLRCKHMDAYRAYHSILLRQLNDRLFGLYVSAPCVAEARTYWNAMLLIDQNRVVYFPERADRIPTTICHVKLTRRKKYIFASEEEMHKFAYWLYQARDLNNVMAETGPETMYDYYINGPITSKDPELKPLDEDPIFEGDMFHEAEEMERDLWL